MVFDQNRQNEENEHYSEDDIFDDLKTKIHSVFY